MAGHLEAARQVLETFFTRTANIKGLKSSPIHQEAKNLYRELPYGRILIRRCWMPWQSSLNVPEKC